MTLYQKENKSCLNISNYLMKKEKKKQNQNAKPAITKEGTDRLALQMQKKNQILGRLMLPLHLLQENNPQQMTAVKTLEGVSQFTTE